MSLLISSMFTLLLGFQFSFFTKEKYKVVMNGAVVEGALDIHIESGLMIY